MKAFKRVLPSGSRTDGMATHQPSITNTTHERAGIIITTLWITPPNPNKIKIHREIH